jgi:hypothetical protein
MRGRLNLEPPPWSARRAARWSLIGAGVAGLLIGLTFVLPWWAEFRFYNWEMSVTRKPEYTLRAFLDRASWLPVIHDIFTRMWFVLVAAMAALLAIVSGWRRASPPLRLLALWVLIGFAELIVHDSGNERRYVMFVPALVALAAWIVGRERDATAGHNATSDRGTASPQAPGWLLAPVVFLAAYLVVGSVIRLLDLEAIQARGDLAWTVRVSAIAAVLIGMVVLWRWRVIAPAIQISRSMMLAAVLLILAIGSDLWQFTRWASERSYLNHEASIAVGRLLPAGTLVHGKLANGLAIENRIRPVFVGRGFGNYGDRLNREDVRYLLTYVQPRLGYEGPVILDILQHLPDERVIATFPVQETAGEDVAALVDKYPR